MTVENKIGFGLFITNSDRTRSLSRLIPNYKSRTGSDVLNLNNCQNTGHKTKVKVSIKIAILVSSISPGGGLRAQICYIQPAGLSVTQSASPTEQDFITRYKSVHVKYLEVKKTKFQL